MWDKLSIKDKANYIKLAVDSGITDLSSIREIYNNYYKDNKFDNGGFTDNSDTEEPTEEFTPSYYNPYVLKDTMTLRELFEK